jgi:hypothetical protein
MEQKTGIYPLLVDEQEMEGLAKSLTKPQVNIDVLRDQLKDIKNRLVGVFEDKDSDGKFALNSLEISLTIGVEGGIQFISKASVEGSIKLTFERNKPDK